jgi:hypothetical protein
VSIHTNLGKIMKKSRRITDKIGNQKNGLKLIMNELGKCFRYSQEQMEFANRFIDDGALIHKMAEHAIAKACGLTMCPDGSYQDFTNGWDVKTGVVGDSTKKTKKTGRGSTIQGIKNKKKGLYIIIADPIVNEVYFFKVPKRVYKDKTEIYFNFRPEGGPRTPKEYFRGQKTITWQLWNECRVKRIKDLGA